MDETVSILRKALPHEVNNQKNIREELSFIFTEDDGTEINYQAATHIHVSELLVDLFEITQNYATNSFETHYKMSVLCLSV